jgi:hypothetical protein
MTATLSITESALLTALRGFLLPVIGGEVIRSQGNRTPMPTGDFCTMTPMFQAGLSTSWSDYTDPGANPGSENVQRDTQWNVQLDFYGPNASDRAAIVAALIRTPYACDQLAASGMQPLYAGEPKQTSLINAEQQYENRWTVDFVAQFNPVVQTPMDFAAQLAIGLADVDVTFPPE